jgi:hypothetical protein
MFSEKAWKYRKRSTMSPRLSGEQLAQQSSFIFVGTVKELQAATMPEVPVNNGTIVVEVNEVLLSPPAYRDYRGQLTVQLPEGQEVKVGEQRVFYTNGWLYGSSLAVQAIDHLAVKGDIVHLRNEIRAAVGSLMDRDLSRRIENADVIVFGEVSEVWPAFVLNALEPKSFHAPDWHEAVIRVASVEKGNVSEEQISVTFPMSSDVQWSKVPKFQPGQRGIYLLKTVPIRDLIGRPEMTEVQRVPQQETFTALDPLDFQPEARLDQVRLLMPRQ